MKDAKKIRQRRVPSVRSTEAVVVRDRPLRPVVMWTSFKGGVFKTTLAVATAERLAYAGAKVLLVSTDPQMDASWRFGKRPKPGEVVRVFEEATGCIDLAATNTDALLRYLYNEKRFTESYDVVVVDTPPESRLGGLDHVMYWVPIDGMDAAQNAVSLLKRKPATSSAVVVGVKDAELSDLEWLSDQFEVQYWPELVRPTLKVHTAIRRGDTVWSLSPRKGALASLLDVASEAARDAWAAMPGKRPAFPGPPKAKDVDIYTAEGWEDAS